MATRYAMSSSMDPKNEPFAHATFGDDNRLQSIDPMIEGMGFGLVLARKVTPEQFVETFKMIALDKVEGDQT